MGDKFYTNIDGRPTLQELTAAGVSLLDSGGYYSSNNLEDLAIELYGRSNKNYCINGNFDIWQRGTSFTNPANVAYTADRITQWINVDGGTPPTIVHSRQTLTPGELDKSFYFYRINANGAGSGYGNNSYYALGLQQIENGTRLLCGLNKKVTISFYIKSNIAGRVVTLEPVQRYGTGGSLSAGEGLTALRITCNTTWTKVVHTFTTNTLSGKTFGTNNDDIFLFQLWLQGGSTYNSRIGGVISWASGDVDIAQIQINPGDTALDYIAPIPSEELIKCMRYYEKSYNDGAYAGSVTPYGACGFNPLGGNCVIGNLIWHFKDFKVTKRIATNPIFYDIVGTSGKVTLLQYDGGTVSGITANPYMTTTGNFGVYAAATSINQRGIMYHYVCDAEF